MGRGSLESGEDVPSSDDQAQKQMDAVKQLGVFLGDSVLKRKIEQTLAEAFSFGHVGRLQSARGIRHSFPSKICDDFAGFPFLKFRTKRTVRVAASFRTIAYSPHSQLT